MLSPSFGKRKAPFSRIVAAISWPPAAEERRASGTNRNADRVVRDVYDFRISNWFVGAANSPKDLAILVDTECCASERNRRLAITTVGTILDTLGPDDYVNVYRYGDTADEVVQCFKESLVQASPENVQEMKIATSSMKYEETPTNISAALGTAFEILHRYNRTGQGSQCNQAIMLITATNAGLPAEVIKRYNWPHMPVRIFTYLIGGDKSPELHDTACANKGVLSALTTHIHVHIRPRECASRRVYSLSASLQDSTRESPMPKKSRARCSST